MVTEVNKGYVKYEVGEFPEDWVLKNFKDIFSFHSTSNYSKAEMSIEGSVGCIHYGLIHAIPNTHYDLSDGIKFYVTEEQAKYDYVKDGDVIMVDASEDISGVNKSVEVFGVGERKYISGLHTYLIRDSKSNLADRFRGIILNSTVIKNQMIQLAVGMKVFGVSKTQLNNIKIPLPPTIEEQKSIATALTDVDELITGLEKLISKKKDIKQGAMQQLLTPPHKGGKRLPGFSREWVEKRLEDLTSMSSGGTPSSKNSKYYDGQIIWVSITDMSNSGKYISDSSKKITNIGLQNSSARMFTLNTLLLAMYASIGKCCITTKEVSTSQAILGINTAKELSTEFLYYFFLFKQKELASQGQQGTQSNLNKGMVQDLLISTPEIVEQQAIAQTLSDIDTEIAQLETKKEKYQAIKQGMMQELLTGKIRLV